MDRRIVVVIQVKVRQQTPEAGTAGLDLDSDWSTSDDNATKVIGISLYSDSRGR